MTPPGLRRYRAERLLRKDFSGLRSKVLAVVRSQLRAKGIVLDASDLEACYAQAWHGLYATLLEGETVENPSAWLVLVTFRRAIDESRSAARLEVGAQADVMDTLAGHAGGSNSDFAAALDDRARLRQVFEGLRAALSERECEAASLCYLQGFSRADAAQRMGISEARMRKLMEGAGRGRPGVAAKMGELLDTISSGGWCEHQSSLMRAFAFGILDPEGERHALAMAHCRECPACRAHVASLRGLASVLPLPLLTQVAGSTGTISQASTRGTAGGTGWSGFAGSLTVKLAITAMVLLGTGYAVLGGRAHGSPPTRPVIAPPFADETLSQASVSVRSRHIHTRRSRRHTRHIRHIRHIHSARKTHSASGAVAREFGPEWTGPAPSSTSVRSSRTAREFGIE